MKASEEDEGQSETALYTPGGRRTCIGASPCRGAWKCDGASSSKMSGAHIEGLRVSDYDSARNEEPSHAYEQRRPFRSGGFAHAVACAGPGASQRCRVR